MTNAYTTLVVCGAHLSGMALNGQLIELGAELLCATRTADTYRLYALTEFSPPRPGLIRVSEQGVAIEVEVWQLSYAAFGQFVSAIPSPLCIGKVILEDGSMHSGFLCEQIAVQNARDISHFKGWRGFIADNESH